MCIEELRRAGITLSAEVEAPWGGITVFLEAGDFPLFIEDRAEWYARKCGAFKSQYTDWLETGGLPRCGATTAKGTRCQNPVSGGIQRDFEDWLEEDGGFCKVHGGLSSDEAKQKRFGAK